MMLLANEANPYKLIVGEGSDVVFDKHYAFEEGTRAQLKKVVEWGDEDCTEHPKVSDDSYRIPYLNRHLDCPECWQSLLDEVGAKQLSPRDTSY